MDGNPCLYHPRRAEDKETKGQGQGQGSLYSDSLLKNEHSPTVMGNVLVVLRNY